MLLGLISMFVCRVVMADGALDYEAIAYEWPPLHTACTSCDCRCGLLHSFSLAIETPLKQHVRE